MPASCATLVDSPSRVRFTPAVRHEPPRSRRPCPARCRPTREAEQAVSTLTASPRSPYVYESRPATTLRATPVAIQGLWAALCRTMRWLYSICCTPT